MSTYRSGWMLTRSKPRTCTVIVSCLSHTAMQHREAGLRTSAFVYLLRTRLASHTTQFALFRLLGHVYRPDAGACAHVENANFSVRWHRGLVQCVSPCYREHLVVDVHAVFFGLRVSVRIPPNN